MFIRVAQADDTNGVVIRDFGENHHMQPGTNQSESNKAHLTETESIIHTIQRRISVKAICFRQRNAVLGPIDPVLRWIKPKSAFDDG